MKRRYAEEWTKWRVLVSEQIQSGQSVAAFCRDRGLRDGLFYDWKKRFREVVGEKFVEVEVATPGEPVPVTPAYGMAIELRLNKGRSLVIEPGFDASHLRALLAVLESGA
jgi:hypothetical protein